MGSVNTQSNQLGDIFSSDAGLIDAPQPSYQQNALSRVISGIDERDAATRYEIERGDNGGFSNSPDSSCSSAQSPTRKIIAWDDGDPANPYNWSSKRKAYIVMVGMVVVINSTMGSSLPSNAIGSISDYFNLTNSYDESLPISMYLVGYILGPILFGPLSETYGRRLIMFWTFLLFTIFTMACAVAPSFGSFLFFRLAAGINASSPIAVTGGIYADIYDNPVTRGRAMAFFIGGTCVGPIVAPLLSGFTSTALGWRWVFWIALIFAGVTWPILIFLPETYGPILLAKRAARLRKSTGNPDIYAPLELEKKGFKQMATVTLTRPLRMICFELIVLATCLYLSLAYGIFYMYFTAYPIVFSGIYKQSPGVAGLMFLPVGVGAIFATLVFLWWDGFLRRAKAQNKPWTTREEASRLPLAFLGGPLYVISLFWLGWTAREDIHFVVPMLAGVPFGMGFILIFMGLLNYLTDAYEIFAASSMAAASCTRSLAGSVLPFAAKPMYTNLGVAWASSLLGFLSLGMCAVPFVFYWKGDKIRAGSKFCIYLREKKEKEAEERRQERETRERQRQTRDTTYEPEQQQPEEKV